MEAKGGHWYDQTLDRMLSLHDRRVRSVAIAMHSMGR
jgi:hypothetical protein